MSKAVQRKNAVQMTEDLETSDDDYIDPAMDKYFKTDLKEKKKSNGIKRSVKATEPVEESEGSEAEADEESEDPEESEDEAVEAEEDELDEEDEGDDERKQLTMKMVENWSQKLMVC